MFIKIIKLTMAVGILTSLIILPSCSYETFDNSSDYDSVITQQNQDYKFSKNKTYAVLDSMQDFSDKTSNPIEIKDFEKWEKIILERIDSNMKKMGYTKEDGKPEDADVVLAAGVVASENWQYYGYNYWWGWSGWYYYYPSYVYAVDMSYGSVLISMIDPDLVSEVDTAVIDTDRDSDGNADKAYMPIWNCGIISLFSSITKKKVEDKIDQAFKQSPYLNLKGGSK